MRACFIGHRVIQKDKELIFFTKKTIIELIDKGVTVFLFGSMSQFNDLSWEIVTELKATYPFIKRVYVRSNYKNIEKSYEKFLLRFYEETYFPPRIENAGRYSYLERNYEMIKDSTYCVFYYNENYIPTLNRKSKSNMLLPKKRKSGTKTAYDYAVKQNKTIINLFK